MADEKTKRSPEDRRAKMYDKSAEKPAEKKSTPEPKKEPEGAGEGKGEEAAGGYKAMMKRHEAERRDAHGAHKENLRKMASRHEGEIKQFMDEKMGGEGGGGQDADPAAGASPAANGGAMDEEAGE